MTRLFEIRDKTNKMIYLSDERWKHIVSRHPEVNNKEEIQDALAQPTVIQQDKLDDLLHYCYRFNKTRNR